MYPSTYEEKILKALVTYHYLTTDQVTLLMGYNTLRLAQMRLKHLTDEGYLWKIHRRTTEQNLPQRPAYTISAKAQRYLEEQGRTVLPAREPKPLFLDHNLAINDILIRVFLLPKARPERYKLLHLEHDRDLKNRNLGLPLIPDGFFEMADLQRMVSFPTLLEIDLDTEDRLHWEDKVKRHLSIQGAEAKRVFEFRHPDIFVVTKPHHVQEIKRWTEAYIKRTEYELHERLFWFGHLPGNETAVDYLLSRHFLQGGKDEPVHLFSR